MKHIFRRWSVREEAESLIPLVEQRLMHTRLAIIEAQAKESELVAKLAYLKGLVAAPSLTASLMK